jgi:uncharacterized protein (TIGR03086 family)
MGKFDVLDLAKADFEKRLRLVTDDQRDLPTPCADFTVRDLVYHEIRGVRGATVAVRGGSTEDVIEAMTGGEIAPNWTEAFNGSYRTMRDMWGMPGVMDRTVHFPIGDIPATLLLQMRIGELAIHGWDLARAIGVDDTIDPVVAAAAWETYQPMVDQLVASGVFGTGPSGNVPDSAPLQTRLLDLTGRRP